MHKLPEWYLSDCAITFYDDKNVVAFLTVKIATHGLG